MSGHALTSATMSIGDLPLRSGNVLRDVGVAYTTTGTLAPGRDNVVLVTHGFTSSHLFIARDGEGLSEGSWANLVGPGAAVDTDRFFVVSSNMLGSSFGSTAPASVDPAAGRPYGPDFPDLTLSDIVAAQHRLLGRMGIDRLVAVVGPSYGGFQALTWAIDHPDSLRGISMSVSGLHAPGGNSPEGWRAQLSEDPNWNGGHYYDRGGIAGTMTRIRERTLRGYGLDEALRERFPEPGARAAEITRQARLWAGEFDGNSLVALATAMKGYDARPHLGRIKVPVQFVLSRTDKLFPPETAPGVMDAFRAAGVEAEYVEIDSEFGHNASGADWARWAPALRRFMDRVADPAHLSASG